ncbi:MAG: sulfatase-like hydrolase/transferase [Bacteroidia bacterium]
MLYQLRSHFFLALCLGSLLFIANHTYAQANDSFPNLLLIIADDMGVDVTPGYHNGALMPTTPTLDSLRSVGITFENVWSAPVCTPTRAGIMSGKFGVKSGVSGLPGNLNLSDTSIFNILEQRTNNRYADAAIGKWHLSSNPTDPLHPEKHGLDYYMGYLGGAPRAYDNWSRTENGVTTTDRSYVTSTVTDTSISWIAKQQQPWFLWLAHAAPHTPFHEPTSGLYTISPTDTDFRKYLAMIESVDHEVNRLLKSMPDSVRDNTLVIFAGDNGTPQNVLQDYPNRHGKGTLYQGGIRVPMIIAGKGVTRKGEREAALVHLSDLHATILEATGETLPGGVFNSLSFNHLLDNSPGPTRDYNYINYTSMRGDSWAIRNAQYKLIENPNGSQEMYDLLIDSLEVNDLIPGGLTAAQQTIKADLEAEAMQIFTLWSCRDHIMNGDETGIDCGGSACQPCSPNSVDGAFAKNAISLSPNPSTDFVKLDAGNAVIESVTVLNVAGSQMFTKTDIRDTQYQLDLASLKPQLYIVKVVTQAGVFHAKMLKQ